MCKIEKHLTLNHNQLNTKVNVATDRYYFGPAIVTWQPALTMWPTLNPPEGNNAFTKRAKDDLVFAVLHHFLSEKLQNIESRNTLWKGKHHNAQLSWHYFP